MCFCCAASITVQDPTRLTIARHPGKLAIPSGLMRPVELDSGKLPSDLAKEGAALPKGFQVRGLAARPSFGTRQGPIVCGRLPLAHRGACLKVDGIKSAGLFTLETLPFGRIRMDDVVGIGCLRVHRPSRHAVLGIASVSHCCYCCCRRGF